MKKTFALVSFSLLLIGCAFIQEPDVSISDRGQGIFEVYVGSRKIDSENKLRSIMQEHASRKCVTQQYKEVGTPQEGVIVVITEGKPLPNEYYVMEGTFVCE